MVDEDEISMHVNRLELNVKLLQTFMAEQMLKAFGSRKTFDLFNERVEVFRSTMQLKQVERMQPHELFVNLADEIKSRGYYEPVYRFIAMLSFTSYRDDATSREIENGLNKVGYCALGERLNF